MSRSIKCSDCGEPISEDDDSHGCDFCDAVPCDDCVLYWRDDEIGDEGSRCGECCGEEVRQ